MSEIIFASFPSLVTPSLVERVISSPSKISRIMGHRRSDEAPSINTDKSCSDILEVPTPSAATNTKRRDKRKRHPPQEIEIINIEDEEEDSDVEVVAPPAAVLEARSSAPATGRGRPKRVKTSKSNDEEIVEIGRSNVQRLPHLRPHCIEVPFACDKASSFASFHKNMKHCSLCYCYVCDTVVSSCLNWKKHCSAVDRGDGAEKWKKMKDKLKKDKLVLVSSTNNRGPVTRSNNVKRSRGRPRKK